MERRVSLATELALRSSTPLNAFTTSLDMNKGLWFIVQEMLPVNFIPPARLSNKYT